MKTKFTAKQVDSFKNVYADDFAVFNLFFEESDPEQGGESWNFQRALGTDGQLDSLGEEDEGVCTVKEIQQVVLYEEIDSIELSRNKLTCTFNTSAIPKAGIEVLEIEYDLDNSSWEKLKENAKLVFQGREYFKIA